MAIPPLPPRPSTGGVSGDFQLPALDDAAAQPAQPGNSAFGDMLGKALDSLSATQVDAASQSQALATGQASDVSSVVMSVERASLALQVAAQVRNKAVEAYQDIFRMQV